MSSIIRVKYIFGMRPGMDAAPGPASSSSGIRMAMRRLSFISAVLLLFAMITIGAVRSEQSGQSFTGEISDSACNKEHVAAEGAEVPPAPECVKICLRGGSKYVFVADGENVYRISNQDNPDLAKF